MVPPLEVRALSKRYGETDVLREVDLTVPRGSIVSITGRSGSGKSTLFKLLAGLDRPSSGQILIDGTDVANMSEDHLAEIRLRRIGLVFQSFNLLPDLNVRENVRLPLDIAGVPRARAEERVAELLELVGLSAAASRSPHVLSGGESQRVAIARALANDPTILLADEPTGSLDSTNAENVLRMFEKLNEQLGATVLIITHDPDIVDRFAHRCTLIDGRLQWDPVPR